MAQKTFSTCTTPSLLGDSHPRQIGLGQETERDVRHTAGGVDMMDPGKIRNARTGLGA